MKPLSIFLVFALLFVSAPIASAKEKAQTGDWNALKNYINNEVAVKLKGQKTVYGNLLSVDDDGIRVFTTSDRTVSFRRDEVETVWQARLKGGRNTGKGAGIGAGVGAGAGLVYVLANRKSGDGQTALAVPALAIYGAAIGGVIGFFARKSNKKVRLIYQA